MCQVADKRYLSFRQAGRWSCYPVDSVQGFVFLWVKIRGK